jgi:WXG100 family type VII secretion target
MGKDSDLLSDNSLEVDPERLHRAARALDDHHVELRHQLRGIDTAHSTLQDSWSGPAARAVADAWTDLCPIVDEHMVTLGDHVQRLHRSAEGFARQDDSNAESIRRSSLTI